MKFVVACSCLLFFVYLSLTATVASSASVKASTTDESEPMNFTEEDLALLRRACTNACKRRANGNFLRKNCPRKNPTRCIFCRNFFRCNYAGSAAV